MSTINGYDNEFEFVKELNGKMINELNPMFYDLIKISVLRLICKIIDLANYYVKRMECDFDKTSKNLDYRRYFQNKN